MEARIAQEVESILTDALERVSKLINGNVPRRFQRPEQTLDRHVASLLAEVQTPLSVNQIAEAVGSPPASIRGILYGHPELFVKMPESPGRMRWTVFKAESEQANCDAELAIAGVS